MHNSKLPSDSIKVKENSRIKIYIANSIFSKLTKRDGKTSSQS